MAASDLVLALQTAVDGFNTVVDGKQPTIDAKLPTAQTALDGTRVFRDGALVARDTTIASRDAAYRDLRSVQANLDHQDLSALVASKAVNAVDVFIYDTSRDSDGGAWRKRCTRTSWFNEPLNTATRGARREFPAVAVIVAEIDKVTIYDGDDPDLPMWMVFNTGLGQVVAYGNDVRSVVAVNAQIVVGSADTGGLSLFSMLETPYRLIQQNGHYVLPSRGLIANRNAGVPWPPIVNAEPRLVDTRVLDVAVTVLPDAPIDPATGLPVPTIAVATEGGVSVINDDGAVTDSTDVLSMITVGFDELDGLFFARTGSANHFTYAPKEDYRAGDGFGIGMTSVISNFPIAAFSGIVQPRLISRSDQGYVFGSGLNAYNVVAGVARHVVGPVKSKADFAEGMSALLTSTYNTGWLPGDIRGAFLADTDATDLVGGTDADRSVKNTPLTVNGTITRAPVATGAELVAYSGFSASNYLEQPYNPDLDFGTGDFCVMGWMDYDGGSMFCRVSADMELVFRISGGKLFANFGGGVISGATFLASSAWQHAALVRASGQLYLYLNARLDASPVAHILDLDDIDAVMRLGVNQDLTNFYGGSLALWRISATAPTHDQIRRIYEDEKVLFQENAACTLYGASDAVTALAHDPDTGLLHVGTSAGRSVFKGLRRVDNTTQPVTTAISAANGMVIEQ